MRVGAVPLLALLVLFAGCGDQQDGAITAEEILGIVSDSLEGSHDLPLTEVVGIHETSSDEVIVVDRTPPYVRVYRGDSVSALGGKSGAGPGELRIPWRSSFSGGELSIIHHGNLSRLTFPGLNEIERSTVPRGALSVHGSCADTITYLITLERGNKASQLAVTSDAMGAGDFGEERLARFAPAGLGLYGLQTGDTLSVLDPYERKYRRLSCGGEVVESREVPALEEHSLIPRIHGGAMVGNLILFATNAPSPADGTNLFVFYPDGGIGEIHFAGDYRLFDGGEEAIWLIRDSLEPVALKVPKSALKRVFSRG